MVTLSNKEKRKIIDRVATDVLLTDDRLAIDLFFRGRDYTWTIGEYDRPVWMLVRKQLGKDLEYKDLHLVRRSVAALANTLELPKLRRQVRLTYDSPVELKGPNAVRIARRCDLIPASVTVDALQAMSRFPFVLDRKTCEVFVDIRKSLKTKEEREAFIPERTLVEWGLITGVFFCDWGGLDEQNRAYARSGGTVAPMYDKVSRAVARHAEPDSLSTEDFDYWASWMRREFKFEGDVDAWTGVIIANPHRYADNPMAIGAAFAWFDARKTGKSGYILFQDAPASGLGHIYATLGHGMAKKMLNMNAEGYEHPYMRLAKTLRNIDIHNLRGADIGEVRNQISKPCANPGQYGGMHMAMASKIMDLAHDGTDWLLGIDVERQPKIPALLQPAFEGMTDREEICDKMVEMCKPYAKAFRSCFPPVIPLNKQTQAEWKAGMEADGIPSPIVDKFGYVNQPTPFDMKKLMKRDIVTASWYEENNGEQKRIRNNFVAYKFGIATSGTQALAKKIHQQDGKAMAIACNDLTLQGIDSVWIHDAGGAKVKHASKVNRAYTRALETLYAIDLGKDAICLR